MKRHKMCAGVVRGFYCDFNVAGLSIGNFIEVGSCEWGTKMLMCDMGCRGTFFHGMGHL